MQLPGTRSLARSILQGSPIIGGARAGPRAGPGSSAAACCTHISAAPQRLAPAARSQHGHAGDGQYCVVPCKKGANKGKQTAKADLPSKTCIVCGLPFTWRKKWEKVAVSGCLAAPLPCCPLRLLLSEPPSAAAGLGRRQVSAPAATGRPCVDVAGPRAQHLAAAGRRQLLLNRGDGAGQPLHSPAVAPPLCALCAAGIAASAAGAAGAPPQRCNDRTGELLEEWTVAGCQMQQLPRRRAPQEEPGFTRLAVCLLAAIRRRAIDCPGKVT
jgi:hypothetical protein